MRSLLCLFAITSTFLLTFPISLSAGEAKIVTCTATEGFHCTPGKGCLKDATYITTYKVDLDQMTVEELTVQHAKRDPGPQPGSTTYKIIKFSPSTISSGEKSITAIGVPGLAAAETILIGERSYLSSSVSSAGTRIFNMMGTCKGFH